jgi:hypothetical protein
LGKGRQFLRFSAHSVPVGDILYHRQGEIKVILGEHVGALDVCGS